MSLDNLESTDAFMEGAESWEMAGTDASNPYDEGSDDWHNWRDGYQAAQIAEDPSRAIRPLHEGAGS